MSLESPPVLPSGKKQIAPNESPCHREKAQGLLRLWMPRVETLILLIGLACTVWGKLIIVLRQNPPGSFAESAQVILPDVLFFSAVFLFISFLYMLKPSVWIARFALTISALVLTWSVLNSVWLIESGVQLQPGILMVLAHGSTHIWPLVLPHIVFRPRQAILLGMMTVGVCACFLWCLIRPAKVASARIHHARWSASIAVVMVLLLLVKPAIKSEPHASFITEILDFNSHWYALVSTLTGFDKDRGSPLQSSNILHAGQRRVVAPKCPSSDLPNVLLVLLESVSYPVSLGHPELETMPTLARLAREGAEFRLTRVPVPYTNKAYWATLTATDAVIHVDNVEAVTVEQPYEGLPCLLAKVGYRSGFFEMSKGSFECAPGIFSNLGFDWAWFRENFEDPSAHIGYLGGDDCRMIKPAFEWALKSPRPFFLMMITSISHDPYEVPAWFDKPREDTYEKYIQTLRYTDYFLEQLCLALKERGLEKDTILCVLGDHGTSFRVKAGKSRWVPYEEVIRVPWVIRWPGHIEAGEVIDRPCSQLDVTPTILKLIGFDITEANFEGRDAFTASDANRRLYFSCLHPNTPIGFVEGSRKIVYWPYLDKIFEYDLDVDPEEENPAVVPPGRMEQIKREILSWEKKSQIEIDAKRYTTRFLFSHWRTFSAGRSAWAYYVP